MLHKIKDCLVLILSKIYHNKNETNEEKKKLEFNLSLIEELKNVFIYWCSATTAHGFYNVITARYLASKLIWITLMIVSLFLCYNGAKRSIISYLNYDVTTNYIKSIETPTEFPAVTICNLNPYDLTSNNNTGEFIKNTLISSNLDCKVSLNEDESGLKVISELSNMLKANIASQLLEISNKTERNFKFKSIGFSIEKMLISCFYNGQNCSANEFTWFKSYEYGNCFAFNFHIDNQGNPNKPLNTSQAGIGSGLTIELFVGNQGKQDFYTFNSGIYVAIHNRSKIPVIRYEGFTLPTGTATNIAVSRTNYLRKSTPKNYCKKNNYSEVLTIQPITVNHLNSKLCFEICIQSLLIIPICNCTDPILAFYEDLNCDYKLCSSPNDLECVQNQKVQIENREDIRRNCSQQCPLECDSTLFDSTISSSDYPTEYYKSILLQHDLIKENLNPKYKYDPDNLSEQQIKKINSKLKNSNKKKNKQNKSNTMLIDHNSSIDLKKNVLMISVYYSSLYTTIIQETELVTFETLVGIIGGQLGLCIGVSFLSLAETCEMILILIKICIVNIFNKIFKSSNN